MFLKFFFIVGVLLSYIFPFQGALYSQVVTAKIEEMSCPSSKGNTSVHFTKEEVTQIVHISGLDPRSLCSFVTLSSHVYGAKTIRQALLSDRGEVKAYLNKHYLFPYDNTFFQGLEKLLFSKKVNDSQQVINALVLSDLLYGYKVGETLPLYMELFLFYATSNTTPAEQSAIEKIIPYLSYLEGVLLKKPDFQLKILQKYTHRIRDAVKSKSTHGNFQYRTSGQQGVTQNNPY